jgi:sulfoxide reductase heme-binding subunit YedZ
MSLAASGHAAIPAPAPSDSRRIAIATACNAAIAVLVLAIAGTGVTGVELALRITARVSMLWFLLAYVATPLAELRAGDLSRTLVRSRRSFGVIFGLSMTMHAVFIVWLFLLFQPARPPMVTDADFTIGIPGLLLVALMTVTSFEALRRRLSAKTWGRLHRSGLHVVWAIFFLCLADSVSRKDAVSPLLEYGLFLALLVAAALLRFVAWRRRLATT